MRFGSLVSVTALAVALLAGPARPASAQLTTTLVVNGLSQPLGFVQDPSNPDVQVVLEKTGLVKVLASGVLQTTPFLDLTTEVSTNSERGLLGLAFAPDYADSGRVYVSFTNTNGHSVVARFLRSGINPLQVDPTTRLDLQWNDGQRFIVQPFSNHNGGHIAFGPDGYLYVGLGDGGSANDPDHRAQDPDTLLGKMLRIDVDVPLDDPKGYAIPADNPYVADPALDEIWAFGLRNPWRWSFDDGTGGTGALVIGDVGQGAWEEINYEPANSGGRNYGWRNFEGTHANAGATPVLETYGSVLTDPIHEYSRDLGSTVTGGFVYRGSALPADFVGRYFFADFGSHRVWSLGLALDDAGEATVADVQEHSTAFAAVAGPASFGVDADGELYIVSLTGGAVYRIESTATEPPTEPPPTEPPPTADCTSIQPGADWTCFDGGWWPPGLTPPGSTPPTEPPPTTPPPTADCTSIQPGSDWTCFNGGWWPPGLTPPGSTPPPTEPPPTEPPPTEPPPSAECTSVQPGPDWTCSNGGWLPPDYPGGA